MDDHLVINLRIADMRYPLRIKRSDEEVYRKAADEIDYKLVQYRNYFTGNESQSLKNTDYVVMTALQAVAEKVEWQLRTNSFESRIKELTQELDDYLKKQVK